MYDLREWHILNGTSRRTISLMNNEHIFFCVHSISKAWHCQCQDLTSSFSTLIIGFWEDLYLFVMCAIYKYHILAIGELDFIKERNVSWLLSWYIFSSWCFFFTSFTEIEWITMWILPPWLIKFNQNLKHYCQPYLGTRLTSLEYVSLRKLICELWLLSEYFHQQNMLRSLFRGVQYLSLTWVSLCGFYCCPALSVHSPGPSLDHSLASGMYQIVKIHTSFHNHLCGQWRFAIHIVSVAAGFSQKPGKSDIYDDIAGAFL